MPPVAAGPTPAFLSLASWWYRAYHPAELSPILPSGNPVPVASADSPAWVPAAFRPTLHTSLYQESAGKATKRHHAKQHKPRGAFHPPGPLLRVIRDSLNR
jgi:hypothetical protein